jgi:hypothetical protein
MNKSELIKWIINEKLDVHFWFEGHALGKVRGHFLSHRFLENWVQAKGVDLITLQDRENVDLYYFYFGNPPVEFKSTKKIQLKFEELVVMEDEIKRVEDKLFKKKAVPSKHPRVKKTNLHIIGGMLELLLGKETAEEVSNLKCQASIIEALLISCNNMEGISKRTIEGRFAKANRFVNSLTQGMNRAEPLSDDFIIGLLLKMIKDRHLPLETPEDIIHSLINDSPHLPQDAAEPFLKNLFDEATNQLNESV